MKTEPENQAGQGGSVSISCEHKGKEMIATVGDTVPAYYQTDGPVIAILGQAPLFAVCSANRGVIRGEPILVGSDSVSSILHFDR